MILILFLLFALPLQGEVWTFTTHPSSSYEQEVRADWTAIEAIEVELQLKGKETEKPVYLSSFLKCHKGWWFESVQPLTLDGSVQKLYLRLDEGSPDWQTSNIRRAYGRDALRWLDSWGLKVFSEEAIKGEIEILNVHLVRQGRQSFDLSEVVWPEKLEAGRVSDIGFRLHSVISDPYNSEKVAARLVWEQAGERGIVEAYHSQDYVEVDLPYHDGKQLLPLERPLWKAHWRPEKSGEYLLHAEVSINGRSFRELLGTVTVEAPTEKETTTQTYSKPSLLVSSGLSLLAKEGKEWVPKERSPSWQMQLDWIYTKEGLGEFSQENAWRLEQEIANSDPHEAHPILLVRDEELTDGSIFRWDEELNKQLDNYGRWYSTKQSFSSKEETLRLLKNRARYLWSRYGHHAQVSGLLIGITSDKNKELLQKLADSLPDIPLFTTHPSLYPKRRGTQAAVENYWQAEPTLGQLSEFKVSGGKVQLKGEGESSFAAVYLGPLWHLADSEAFFFDVELPEHQNHETKVSCFLRLTPTLVIESPLQRVVAAKTNRVIIPLHSLHEWQIWGENEGAVEPWMLLNVQEVGLRFFNDSNRPLAVTIHAASALPSPTHSQLAITDLVANKGEVPRYTKAELRFLLNRSFHNPYDPREVDATLTVTAPSGHAFRQPAFYHEPHEITLDSEGRELVERTGEPEWLVRWSPKELGEHKWTLTIVAEGESTSRSGTTRVIESDRQGFLSAASTDPRYLETSRGNFFYPIGYCMRSPADLTKASYSRKTLALAEEAAKQGVATYERWFDRLSAAGGNQVRMWISPWWCPVEWNPGYDDCHGLGFYSQKNGSRVDRILAMAEDKGIYLHLDLMNHGQLSSHINSEWLNNPLCKAQPGGFLQYATEACEHPEALRLQRQRLRYMLSRWGYSPNILAWGVCTELDWVEPIARQETKGALAGSAEMADYFPSPYHVKNSRGVGDRWIEELTRYVHEIDVHNHLATVQYAFVRNSGDTWKNPVYDLIYNNVYTADSKHWGTSNLEANKGVADALYLYSQQCGNQSKLSLISEWGGAWDSNKESHLIAESHTGLWTSVVVPLSGATGYWWANLVDAEELFSDYEAIARFMASEERRGRQLVSRRAEFIVPTNERTGYLLTDAGGGCGYLLHQAINRHSDSTIPKGFDDTRFPATGEVELKAPPELANGVYEIEYWNTFTGEVIGREEITLRSESRVIPVANHRVDIAFKIRSKA